MTKSKNQKNLQVEKVDAQPGTQSVREDIGSKSRITGSIFIFLSAIIIGICVQQALKIYAQQNSDFSFSNVEVKLNHELSKFEERMQDLESERQSSSQVNGEKIRSLVQAEIDLKFQEFKTESENREKSLVDKFEKLISKEKLPSNEEISLSLRREIKGFIQEISRNIEDLSAKLAQNEKRLNELTENSAFGSKNDESPQDEIKQNREEERVIQERQRIREKEALERRKREEQQLQKEKIEREVNEKRLKEEKEQIEKLRKLEEQKRQKKENPKNLNDEKQDNVPDEIKNFQSIRISELKPKKMWIPIPGSNGGHRRVPQVEIKPGREHKSSVKVWLYEEFLSEEECDQLVKAHESHVTELKKQKPIVCFDSVSTLRRHLVDLKKEKISQEVTPNVFTEGTMCLNETFSRSLEKWGLKWSISTSFYLGESKFSKIYSRRIEEATQLNETHGGKFQITSYPFGIGYRAHHDCLLDSDEQRDRYATFLVYLNDLGADGGGETNFTEIRIDVKPRKGRALVWNNMNYKTGKCESESIHEANPVKLETKKKYIIQRWYYYKSFYALGKRYPEPQIPTRKPGQPRVSCDQYDFGSCRLYDEWNYDHLIEYQNRKNTLH